MGWKSSGGTAQTTRFKRRLSNHNRNNVATPLNITSTPPTTPFNNTSFLIQLQQWREQGSPSTRLLKFDQYGSMENMITCCSFTTSFPQTLPHHAIAELSTQHSSSNLSILQKESSPRSSQNTDSDTDSPRENSDRDRRLKQHSCSDAASSATSLKVEDYAESRAEIRQRRHHQQLQHFTDDNFDTLADLSPGSKVSYL